MAMSEVNIQGTWTLKQVIRFLIVQALLGLLVGWGTYWYASYVDIAQRLGDRLPAFEESRTEWINKTAEVFSRVNSNISEHPRLPSKGDIGVIRTATDSLISRLNTVPTPTAKIEKTARGFRENLSTVVFELGRYDGTAEATTSIVQASQNAAKAGEKHRLAVERYLGSALNRLLGAF